MRVFDLFVNRLTWPPRDGKLQTSMSSKFVHLHTHSHYSLLQALPKIDDLVAHVKAQGAEALALTDHGNLYGAIEFYTACQRAGIKPILGCEMAMAPNGRAQKRARVDKATHALVLLAETNEGWRHLVELSSIGFLEGFYYVPRIDKQILRAKVKGLIGLSGGYKGEINQLLKFENDAGAREVIREYVSIFGEGNFFLELVDRPEIAEQTTMNAKLIELGRELGVPLVATKNTSYLYKDQVQAWKILNCIKGGKTLEHFERMEEFEYDASVVAPQVMEERFADVPEALTNTRAIADRCAVELTLGEWNFPRFEIPQGKTFREVLTERTFSELPPKVGLETLTQEMVDRLNYELDIIDQKGFCPYFLIVSDFIEWARRNGIVTTTRGSAAGSLVGYAVGISGINPLIYKLPFERFLNPERPSAPDIDADFADNRRDEVLAYVSQKYGEQNVAQICTFGKMLARGSIRDVGRALGHPYGFVDEIAKLVPMGSQGFPMTLERALEEARDLKALYDRDGDVRQVIDLAKQIEGCARHVSIHAAGTVIAPTALTEFTPLQIDTRVGKVITQFEMHAVESAGLIKMDFLGIRNLSILGDAVKIVKKTRDIDINIEAIPVDDAQTFALLAKGHTMGVFQLSGDGMTKYLMDLKPSRVEDIMAMVALYRPGPIESIPEYIRRKHDPSLVTFMDARMKEILDQSYGVIVYQDDVMLIAIKLAGYSWLEADKLRKAMGKKIPEEMAQQKIKLLDGFVKHGMTEKKARLIWKLIEPFAAYGFNKAHAASYGMIAYYTAYMKAKFPAQYMAALMTAESGDLEKIAEAVAESERLGIAVLAPDINESLKNFTYISDTQIRFGLLVIKNLGEEVIEAIIAERKQGGLFKDLTDFAGRVSHRAFNKKSLESLIKVGALDRFGERAALLANMDRILLYNKQAQREREQNQQSLFSMAPQTQAAKISLRSAQPASMTDLLVWEKELLGLYVSGHPYQEAHEKLHPYLSRLDGLGAIADKTFIKCGGLLSGVKQIVTKKGDDMAFVTLEDRTGSAEVVVFPKTFATYKAFLEEGRIVLLSARVSERGGEKSLMANSFIVIQEDVDELAEMLAAGMWVESSPNARHETDDDAETADKSSGGSRLAIVLSGRPDAEVIASLRALFSAHQGTEPVYFLVESAGRLREVRTDYAVLKSPELLEAIAELVGRQNLVVT